MRHLTLVALFVAAGCTEASRSSGDGTDARGTDPDRDGAPDVNQPRTWRPVPLVPDGGIPIGTVNTLWGRGSAEVFASLSFARVARYDGTQWHTEALFGSLNAYSAFGLWGDGTGNVVAAGSNGRIFQRVNGTWTERVSGVTSSLRSLWGVGDHYYAVGDSAVILHSLDRGTTWTPETLPAGNFMLSSVWGASASDIYAVGVLLGGAAETVVLHSTGDGTWTRQPTSGSTYLRAITGSGPNDLHAVGDGGTILHSTGDGTWTPQSSTTTTQLLDVWQASAEDVVAVGAAGTLLHRIDGAWTAETSGTTQTLGAVWGSGGGDVYVGGMGTLLHAP